MAHTVRSQGATNPHQSIRRRARIRSGGSGRYTPTAVRLAPPDRTGGRPSGPWRPSNGSPHGPSHPCCVPWPEGLDTGGAGLGPQGCTRCPTGAASFRSDLRRPPPVITHHQLSIPPPPPLPYASLSCQFGPAISGLDLRTFVLFTRETPAVRGPGDRSPFWHVLSRSVVFLSSFQVFSFQHLVPESIIPVHTSPSLSHLPLNEQHQLPGHPHVAFTS